MTYFVDFCIVLQHGLLLQGQLCSGLCWVHCKKKHHTLKCQSWAADLAKYVSDPARASSTVKDCTEGRHWKSIGCLGASMTWKSTGISSHFHPQWLNRAWLVCIFSGHVSYFRKFCERQVRLEHVMSASCSLVCSSGNWYQVSVLQVKPKCGKKLDSKLHQSAQSFYSKLLSWFIVCTCI